MLAKKYRLQIQDWLKERKKNIIRRSDFFVVKMSVNDLNFSRFGVVISAKVSKSAVQRNRIKRIIYDFIRLNEFHKKSGRDVVITVLPATAKLERSEIENQLAKFIHV